jgi:hypothetical protein
LKINKITMAVDPLANNYYSVLRVEEAAFTVLNAIAKVAATMTKAKLKAEWAERKRKARKNRAR